MPRPESVLLVVPHPTPLYPPSSVLCLLPDFDPHYSSTTDHSSFNTHILLINLSLLTGLPFPPPANRGVSVHISLTFSSTILQCRSNAFTRANSLRLLRQDIRTWVWERTAVCRIERGPDVNSYSSICAISYSLGEAGC